MRNAKGVILVFVLLMVLAILAAVVGTLYSANISQYVGRADRYATLAERTAQTGLDGYRSAIFQNVREVVAEGSDSGLTAGNSNGPACNLLIYSFDGPNGDFSPNSPAAGAIPLSQQGDGYGRFEVTLDVANSGNFTSVGRLRSKGEVLIGYPDGKDPITDYDKVKPVFPYPQASLRQTLYAHNASLMSHALITGTLDSKDQGLAVMGPVYIEGSDEIKIGQLGNSITSGDGDLVPFDHWVCLDKDGDPDGDGDRWECGESGSGDETTIPARPWSSKTFDVTENLAESNDGNGPFSSCTRIRLPNGNLTGSNDSNDLGSIGQLFNITGVHVGVLPDDGGMPVKKDSDDTLAVAAGFKNRPSLTTPYDLDKITSSSQGPQHEGLLEVPNGLADYASGDVSGQQRQETVSGLSGGKSHNIASSGSADKVISYEWLRVNESGDAYKYYVHGLSDSKLESCVGGSKVIHPDYDSSADTNASFVQPPLDCIQNCPLGTCALAIANFPTTGQKDSQVIADSGDIVWPTYDKDDKLVSSTGNINSGGKNKIPKFNLKEGLDCMDDDAGFTWDSGSMTLEVRGTVVLEGIEFPIGEVDQVNAVGDGVLVLREREIGLIADHNKYQVEEQTCVGLQAGFPPTPCICTYDEIVQSDEISIPTSDATENGGKQSDITSGDQIGGNYFALFSHGGKAGYSGGSSNGFTQQLPNWIPEEDTKDFPVTPVPMLVSDPKFANELQSDRIYTGIWYHDNAIVFLPEEGPEAPSAAVVGKVMAPTVSVQGKGAQIFGVSGYEYHLNPGFEAWLEDGVGMDPDVVKNLPVFNITSETVAD